jgi:biopolymer transport protein ExbB
MLAFASRLITDGGPVIMVLGALSVLSLTVIVVKLVQFIGASGGAGRIEQALGYFQSGATEQAANALAAPRTPAARVLAYALGGLAANLPLPVLEAEVERRANSEVERLGRFLRILELVALISPLLGLLGTVLGMIQSFQELEMAEGAANASVLAGGIWQALLTTAVGLMVAIPAAIAATLFSAGADRAAHLIESSSGRLLLLAKERPRQG